jgi:hypothetical protein
MSSDNQINLLKQGLVQYVGAMIISLEKMDIQKADHLAIAKLSEVWLEFSRDEDGNYDMFRAKPLFRAVSLVLKRRIAQVEESLEGRVDSIPESFKKKKKEYLDAAALLDNLVESVGGK